MAKMQQSDERVSYGVNLLVSILVRYPEIGSINFDATNNTLKLTFMLATVPTDAEYADIKRILLTGISAYHVLEQSKENIAEITFSSCEQVAMLTIMRDVATLSKGEIGLIIGLLRDNFANNLIVDENAALLEEDLIIQEELIGNMLENVKTQRSNNGLIGIREDGRVFVFNK